MPIRKIWVGLFLVAISLLGERMGATSVRPVNLPEMVGLADRVFYGVCLGSRDTVEESSGFAVKEFQFRVISAIKGVDEGEVVTFRQLSGRQQTGFVVTGMPSYSKGASVLLFLHGDSRLGLTSPVGMLQGTFEPVQLSDGTVGFLNAAANQNLSYGLSETQAAEAGLSLPDLERLRSGEPLRFGELAGFVRRIESVAQTKEVLQ